MTRSSDQALAERLFHVFEKGTAAQKDVDVFVIEPMKTESPENKGTLLIKKATPSWERGSTLNQVCSSLFYVYVDDPLDKIVEELSTLEDVFALGVTDSHGEALGVIIRRELFDLMGRSYGKSFIENKQARSVMKYVKSFTVSSHIFSVAPSIEEELNAPLINYFLIKDKYRRFAGVFSSKDMMRFYSRTLNREMELVQSIQRSIVEPEITYHSEKDYLNGVSKPSQAAGGDYYCIRELDEQRLFYCVADVSGKGYPASLITSIMGSILENTTFSGDLEGSLKKLNTYLQKKFEDMGIFVTGLFVMFDKRSGLARVCDCGHQHFFLFRERSLRRIKGLVNPPLGLMEELDFKIKTISMKSRDAFLIVTDGLMEQCNEQGEEYPLLRLMKALMKEPDSPSGKDVLEDIQAFRGFSHQHDDMTLLFHQRR